MTRVGGRYLNDAHAVQGQQLVQRAPVRFRFASGRDDNIEARANGKQCAASFPAPCISISRFQDSKTGENMRRKWSAVH